ncbi:Retrotransposable element Tf2 [Cucumis melo var. makuwa]|uniref:Retrotransposable element Tf2 n=1 Tax=Cucumis melo var. makuwa TaxID=1194695 RepID=A0A5D3DHL2_CUCMM|nr:Retrotransposable element Tf2 [Cucumis melo var. makuwa]
MLSNFGRLRPSGRPPPPLPSNQPNPANSQPASSSKASSSKGKRPISQASTLAPMCTDNYAMDLSFQTVSQSRQGSSRRNVIIGSNSNPSTTLLRPISVATSNSSASRPQSYAQTVKPAVFMPRPLVTEYQTKTTLEDVVIEPEFDRPFVPEICSQVYPHGFNFFSKDIKKTRQFYEFILVDTVSIEITHIPDRNNPEKIVYSKLKNFRVLTSSHWPQGMYVPWKFSKPFNPQSYTYRDYMEVWYKLFWHELHNHSWFITFCKKSYKTNFPNWFKKWWSYFGLTTEIFLVEVQRAYQHFSSSIYTSALSLTYRFSLYFQVPWIFCWSHQLSSRAKFKILGKILRVIWWDKYDYSRLNKEQIAKWVKTNAHLSREEEDQFLLTKNSIMTSIAGAKSEEDL